MTETTKEHPEGGERLQVLSRIVNSLKEDKPVTFSPCGLKLIRCTQGGVEEIKGFEELTFRDKLFILKHLLEIQEDIFNKRKEQDAATVQAAAQKAQGVKDALQVVGS